MGKLKNKLKEMSLKKTLFVCILITLSVVAMLSTITMIITYEMQQHILDTRSIVVEEYSYSTTEVENELVYYINPSEYTFEKLSIKNQILYYSVVFVMMALPISYIVLGMFIIVKIYYSFKLEEPLKMLRMGMKHISANDLDFSLFSNSNDELGMLCNSFENMRSELQKNNKKMWKILRERKALIASVFHDLRTPITVIKGYLDFLMKEVDKETITPATLKMVVDNMLQSTARLEKYVDGIKDIQKIEDIEITRTMSNFEDILSEIDGTIPMIAKKHGKKFVLYNEVVSTFLNIDKDTLFRVLENVLSNGFRFAKEQVIMTISEEKDYVSFYIQDDGQGFTKEDLEKASTLFYSSSTNKGAFGIGLYISKILCEKMGGALYLRNNISGGAVVEIKIEK